MTRTQFVESAGNGFWAYDVGLGVFLKHLIDAAEARGHADAPWLSQAVSWWRVVACISDYGLRIGDAWSPDERDAFVALADEACRNLATREAISAEEIVGWRLLADQRMSPRGASEVQTLHVIELGRAIIDLVRGRVPEPPQGKMWIYGTPSGRGTL